jgi:hypothetical protein
MRHRRRIPLLLGLVATLALPCAAEARRDVVRARLDALAAQGRLSSELHATYTRDWAQARRAVRHLGGAARSNLEGVVGNARSLARRGMLGARLAPVFLTIERNYEWFWTERRGPAPFGSRRTFGGSPVILEFYPGSGWQVQPLGNFGKLGGLAVAKHTRPATLIEYADSLLALGVERKGFLAFEYYFPWSGGAPGWISGMAEATGVQAFARVWRRTGIERYRDAAERMLGAFFAPPPWGIRLYRGHGRAHYLQYSQSPRVLVGNAFAQALIGLEEMSRITGSRHAKLALERGLRQARAALSRYDTGAWSLYSRGPGTRRGAESDLHYHQLFESFLKTLCLRLPANGPFCGLHARFARYETEPVRIHALRGSRRGRTLTVSAWASKPGSATLRLKRGGRSIRSAVLALGRGTHVVRWRAPRRDRTYVLRIDAVSLNGVTSSRERHIRLH